MRARAAIAAGCSVTGADAVPRFSRRFFDSGARFTRIGDGELGGKGRGLIEVEPELDAIRRPDATIRIDLPRTIVLATGVFDRFLERNRLSDIGASGMPDDRVAHAFLNGELPPVVLGDLRALVEEVDVPLAVRSSSLLEDARARPFAGVYGTKMTPNNQPDADARFRCLIEAIKFVFASTFFRRARAYRSAAGCMDEAESMAVLIQEIVGRRYHDRFYPDVSGVCRSYNFYPFGSARPEDGQVSLALGLGKTIVDGGKAWSYSPAFPESPPPFGSVDDRLQNTQLDFWAVNMGRAPEYDPIAETEYLTRCELQAADYDGTLKLVASTYDPSSDRLLAGTGRVGPRVLDFAPLLVLKRFPLNETLRSVMTRCESKLGPVEIEFAVTFPTRSEAKARLGFLQVRPMIVSQRPVELMDGDMARSDALVLAERTMGNGEPHDIRDIVYVKPGVFDRTKSRDVVRELDETNDALVRDGRGYVLIGFGRWGSSDPSLGIPVQWEQISGARVIIESSLPGLDVEPSQGSHFFHNISSFGVLYFMVRHDQVKGIDWTALDGHAAKHETHILRHVRLRHPLDIKVDGRTGYGGIWWSADDRSAERETRP